MSYGEDLKMSINSNYINSKIDYQYERMPDYETKYMLKEKHDQLLSVLLAFDQFCRENGIKYSLADGTLLGAIRHGDFIPWDDDADVMVTRDEYNKIIESITEKSSIRILKIGFLDRVTIPDLIEQKIYVDLFINDDMPLNKFVFNIKKAKTRFLRNYFSFKVKNLRHSKYSLLKRIMYRITHAILWCVCHVYVFGRDVFKLNDKAVSIGHHKQSGIYTRFTSRMYETKRRFNKEQYEKGYGNILFRGKTLMSIKSARFFLSEMYGDYISLPKEEQRIPEHSVNMMENDGNYIKWLN